MIDVTKAEKERAIQQYMREVGGDVTHSDVDALIESALIAMVSFNHAGDNHSMDTAFDHHPHKSSARGFLQPEEIAEGEIQSMNANIRPVDIETLHLVDYEF